jgi:hypothetical protein
MRSARHLLPLALIGTLAAEELPSLAAPAGQRDAVVVPGGETVLPNGRLLTPTGQRLYTGPNLFQVAVRPDGKAVVGLSDDTLVIHPLPEGKPGAGAAAQPSLMAAKNHAPAGVFTKDGSRFIISTGDAGHGVAVHDSGDWHQAGKPPAPGQRFRPRVAKPIRSITVHREAHLIDLALSADDRTLFAVDVARQRVVVIDVVEGKVIADVAAGRQPYALALAEDGKRLFVANIGLFDYSLVPAPKPGEGDPRGLSRPAFGFPSDEAEKGVDREGRRVPGLGNPYVPDSQSVWAYDVSNPSAPKVVAREKTGILLHAQADRGKSVGGSAPNELLVRGRRLFVSNANNDTVQILNSESLKVERTIKLVATKELGILRGVIPTGMHLTRDGRRLFVCESGLNSIAVLDPDSGDFLGRIPTGWFPVQLAMSPDEGTLFAAVSKGIGRGPRGSLHKRAPNDERFGLADFPGMIEAIDLSPFTGPKAGKNLAEASARALRNNGMDRTVPARPLPKEIEHVVFITKENHTFDGIFGTLEKAKGEPEYAEYGERGWIREKGRGQRLAIMPNHLKLAREFAISDNFYMEPEASGDGHRWLVGVYPSLWTTRVFYAGWQFARSDTAKGRLVSFGSNGSQIPEDYLENGSLWEHLARGGITFRNYGEGYELPDNDEGPMTNRTGGFTMVNHPMPKVLFDNTCFDFPSYNTNIPDIARVDWFIEDLEKHRKASGGKLPRFLNVALCNDHGAGANSKRGYPYVASYMADNDLALGRIVEYLSKQPEWPKMAIFVTQDDSGGDGDHIDRHRSFVLCISPYAKRGHVSRDHTSIMSIIKTIYRLHGLGPNNLFDAAATDLADLFQPNADVTPYRHVPADPRVFKPEETFDPTDPKFERRRREAAPVKMDDPRFVEQLYKDRAGAEAGGDSERK